MVNKIFPTVTSQIAKDWSFMSLDICKKFPLPQITVLYNARNKRKVAFYF